MNVIFGLCSATQEDYTPLIVPLSVLTGINKETIEKKLSIFWEDCFDSNGSTTKKMLEHVLESLNERRKWSLSDITPKKVFVFALLRFLSYTPSDFFRKPLYVLYAKDYSDIEKLLPPIDFFSFTLQPLPRYKVEEEEESGRWYTNVLYCTPNDSAVRMTKDLEGHRKVFVLEKVAYKATPMTLTFASVASSNVVLTKISSKTKIDSVIDSIGFFKLNKEQAFRSLYDEKKLQTLLENVFDANNDLTKGHIAYINHERKTVTAKEIAARALFSFLDGEDLKYYWNNNKKKVDLMSILPNDLPSIFAIAEKLVARNMSFIRGMYPSNTFIRYYSLANVLADLSLLTSTVQPTTTTTLKTEPPKHTLEKQQPIIVETPKPTVDAAKLSARSKPNVQSVRTTRTEHKPVVERPTASKPAPVHEIKEPVVTVVPVASAVLPLKAEQETFPAGLKSLLLREYGNDHIQHLSGAIEAAYKAVVTDSDFVFDNVTISIKEAKAANAHHNSEQKKAAATLLWLLSHAPTEKKHPRLHGHVFLHTVLVNVASYLK